VSVTVSQLKGGLASHLHISNIPFAFREPDFTVLFGQFGAVIDVEIVLNEKGSKGFGFVSMRSPEEAEVALR
jgi:RNA binding protein fox-1